MLFPAIHVITFLCHYITFMQRNHDIYRKHLSAIDNVLTRLSFRTKFPRTQLVGLIVLPFFIIIGHLMNLFSPEESINNYFTSRGNVINKLFVKYGWFWTILTYSYLLYRKHVEGVKNKATILKSITRVMIITCGWYIFTQWFFGLPIMDRIFILTGGKCDKISVDKVPHNLKHLLRKSENHDHYDSYLVSSATCRIVNGSWGGGHDPSGHIFILTASINLLLLETLELWTTEGDLVENLSDFTFWQIIPIQPIFIIVSVVSLEMMMFLMTVIKYHTLGEQLGGYAFAVLVLWITNVINGF